MKRRDFLKIISAAPLAVALPVAAQKKYGEPPLAGLLPDIKAVKEIEKAILDKQEEDPITATEVLRRQKEMAKKWKGLTEDALYSYSDIIDKAIGGRVKLLAKR